jgi:hypothetical protein
MWIKKSNYLNLSFFYRNFANLNNPFQNVYVNIVISRRFDDEDLTKEIIS